VRVLVYILVVLGAYLLGSIPTGFLVGKARGVDIRTAGSGNIGATNVFRILGTVPGVFVLLADALKGWLAVRVLAALLARKLLPPDWLASNAEPISIIAAVAAVLGHNYTCWLHFRGGKGIATSAGVLAALVPIPLLVILSVWIIVFALSRYVSLASILAASTLPFATWFTGYSTTLIVVTAAMTAMAIYKHKGNIKRLIQGTESRIGRKNTTTAAAPKETS
jgi:glycerol-3-phosphate acyltransferase PlsY